MTMSFKKFLKQSGQTSVEYILVLSVSVSLGYATFKKLNEWFLTNPNSYVGGQLNSFKRILNTSPRYERYSVPR
jgi:hypothetical protein